MMHIAVITDDYPSPGKNWCAYVQARVDIYRRMGHRVTVLTRLEEGSPFRNPEARKPAVVSEDGAHRRLPVELIQAASIDADVAAVHAPKAGLTERLGSLLQEHMPTVAYIHGAEAMDTPWPLWDFHPMERLWRLWNYPLIERFLERCAALVVPSYWAAEAVRAYLAWNPKLPKPTVIPNPVDPELFPFSGPPRLPIGVTMRGSNRKYGLDLLDGVSPSIVHRERPTLPRSQLAGFLQQFSFFVAPSRMDAQGVLMCEMAALGRPVVATLVGGIPEFLLNEHHVLCLPERESIAGGIKRMMEREPWTLPDEDRLRIREDILEWCGPEATVDRDIELFRRAIEGR